MAKVIPLQAKIEQLRGPAKCLACKHTWEAVAPVGTVIGLECPACSTLKGVFSGFVNPGTAWVCTCGNDLFHIKPDWCECVNCGKAQKGF